MVKRMVYFLLLCLFVFYACNDNNDTTTPASPSDEKQLRELIKKYPDSLSLQNVLIDYYAGAGDYDNAIKETNVLLKKDSSNPRNWDATARLQFLNEDTLAAIHSFQKAVALYPDPAYIISLGTLYAQTRNEMALAMADALLQAPKANATLQALFIKGLYYTYSADKAKAISFFDKCLQMDYTFGDAYREKAIALYDLGRYDDAINLLQTAIKVKKTNEEAWYWMGRCYQKLNKTKEAVDSYQVALQLAPDYIEAKDALGKMGVKS